MKKKLKGNITNSGYRHDSPDVDNAFNVIPSNKITMKGVHKKLLLIPVKQDGTKGAPIEANPGEDHHFPDYSHVLEIPLETVNSNKNGGQMNKMYKFVYGGPSGNHKAKDKKLFQTGGPNYYDPNLYTQENLQKMGYIPDTESAGADVQNAYITATGESRIPRPQTVPLPTISYSQPKRTTTQNPAVTNTNIPPGSARVPVSMRKGIQKLGFNLHDTSVNTFGFKEGGPQGLNDKNYLQEKQNDFLNYLRDTAYSKIHDELDNTTFHIMHDGSVMSNSEMEENMKKGGWLKDAVNPAHKGYCTPMSKPTCTGHRRAFALMMKKKHGFHKKQDGGDNPVPTIQENTYLQEDSYDIDTTPNMKRGGSRKKKRQGLSDLKNFCGGPISEKCITTALNSSDPNIRKKATLAKMMYGVKYQFGGDNDLYEEEGDTDFMPWYGESEMRNTVQLPTATIDQIPQNNIASIGPMYPTPDGQPIQDQMMNMEQLGYFGNLPFPGLGNTPINQTNQSNEMAKIKMGYDPEEMVNWGIAGTEFLTSMINSRYDRKREKELRNRTHADSVFTPITGSGISRGDYSVNEGYFRPDQMVPTQFTGNTFQEGGEYYMDENMIKDIIDGGGTVDFIEE